MTESLVPQAYDFDSAMSTRTCLPHVPGELFATFYTEQANSAMFLDNEKKSFCQRMFSKMEYGSIRASIFNTLATCIGAGNYIYIYIYICT